GVDDPGSRRLVTRPPQPMMGSLGHHGWVPGDHEKSSAFPAPPSRQQGGRALKGGRTAGVGDFDDPCPEQVRRQRHEF
ncbi:hypothetical protein, partial [Salmonella enterica]|uniref:hypothetical protein n=1 Tax=Salmonella enterica TaxID=28901 RepID=UPI0019D692B0